MTLQQDKLKSLLDKVLNQDGKLRKDEESVYFCPFCHHYKKKLEINLQSQEWHCWVCNSSGKSIRSFFRKLKVIRGFYTELYKLTNQTGYVASTRTDEIISLPNEFLPLTKPRNSLEYGNAISYLKKRGITRDDIIRHNIGYCEDGEYKHRVITPSYDKDGNINFFSARAYYEANTMKYKLPPWSKDIIGFELFINWDESINLVEGTFDALAIKRNAIPLFGNTMSDKLKEAIIENGVWRVNIILDNDALKSAIRIYNFIEKLKSHEIDIHLIRLTDKNSSILGFEKITTIINESKPMEFIEMMKMKINL